MADVTKINTANSNFGIKNYMKKYADVNSDGKVNIKDVTYIQKQSNNALGMQVDLNGDGKPDINNNLGLQQTGDITGDGKVDNNDVEIIKKFVSGDINDISKNIDKYQIQEFQDETQKKIFSDDLNKQKKYLEKIKATIKLMEYTRNGKDEEEPGWHWGGDALKQRDPNIHLSKEEQKEIENKFGSLEKAKASYEVYVSNIEEAISQIDKDCKLIPYQKIQDSDKYKNSDIKNISKRYYDLLDEEYGEKNAETDTYTLSKETSKRQEQLIKIYGSLDKAKEIYGKIKYLEDKERNMYIYMLSTKGIEEADKYLDIFKKDITQRQGLSEALEFYSVLLKNGDKLTDDEVKKLLYEHIGKEDTDKIVKNAETNGITVLQCFWQGLKDGTVGFFEGLGHVFDNESEKTVSDYKKAFIAQLISSNGYTDNNGNHLSGSDILSSSYNFGSSTGNMLPVILASTLASLIASPAGGEAVFAGLTASELAGKITGSALIGLSSYGNSKHEALCNGYSLQQAIIYGSLNGLSDAGFESLLGSLPGIGTESKTWIMSVLKEGTQEYLQTYVSAGIDAIVLGETKDLSELDAEAQQSFLMGAMMGGMFNSGKLVSNIKVTIKGVNYKLTPSQIADYIKNGTKIDPETGTKIDMTIEEYIKNKPKTNNNGYSLNDFKYKDTTVSQFAINYLKSNLRKYKYTDTNSVSGLNAKIQQNGLYHFTSSADTVLKSGYVKASDMIASYGNKKSFFFNGIPNVGEYASNLDTLPLKTEAVKINPNSELLNSSKFKVRNFDDGAISYDGNLDIKNISTSKEYFCLVKEGNELVYKPVSKEVYDNYQNTAEGKAIQDFVSDKKNISAIKNDYYVSLSPEIKYLTNEKLLKNGTTRISRYDYDSKKKFVQLKLDIPEKELNDIVNQMYQGTKSAQTDYYSFFRAFREHGALHTAYVTEYALNFSNNIKGINSSEIKYGALCHDLGMKGGLAKIGGKFVPIDEVVELSDKAIGNRWSIERYRSELARKNHPLNSALSILTSDIVPSGIDKNVVALLAMSHSKSTSGIFDFSDKQCWLNCIDDMASALQTYSKGQYSVDVEGLKKLINDQTEFERLQIEAMAIRDGDAMSNITFDNDGNIILQTDGVAKIKYGNKRKSYNDEIAKNVEAEIEQEKIVDELVYNGKKEKLDPSNKGEQYSMKVHVGESNTKFTSFYDEKTKSYTAIATPIDANASPNCTFDAITERLDEVATYGNCNERCFKIELPKEAKGTKLGEKYVNMLEKYKEYKVDRLQSEYTDGEITEKQRDVLAKFYTEEGSVKIIIDWK